MAAMYKVLAAIRMHRPSSSAHYSSADKILKTHNSEKWRLWRRLTEVNDIVDDSRHFDFGNALGNLEVFRINCRLEVPRSDDRNNNIQELTFWAPLRLEGCRTIDTVGRLFRVTRSVGSSQNPMKLAV